MGLWNLVCTEIKYSLCKSEARIFGGTGICVYILLLNVNTHTVSDSQKRAVEQVTGGLFGVMDSVGLNSVSVATRGTRVNSRNEKKLQRRSGEPGRTRTYNPLIKSQLLYH
jgi:hypothetical protein